MFLELAFVKGDGRDVLEQRAGLVRDLKTACRQKALVYAVDLALFDKSGDSTQQVSEVKHLEAALNHWRHYAAACTRQYVQPLLYNRVGVVDIPAQTADVAADVQMARNWKHGTIQPNKIKKSRTETGFKK